MLALWLQNTGGVAILAIILLTATLVVPVFHNIGASAPTAFVGDDGLYHALILPYLITYSLPLPKRKMDGEVEARLIALVSGPPPAGRKRWTLRLLAEHLVALEEVPLESISYETIRLTLKKTNLSLGAGKSG